MPFSLPPTFRESYQNFQEAVIEVKFKQGAEKVEGIFRAYAHACELLSMLDLNSFRESVTETYRRAQDDPMWSSQTWQDEEFFNQFLGTFETRILSEYRTLQGPQEIIFQALKGARLPAARLAETVSSDPAVLAKITTGSLEILQRDICAAARHLADTRASDRENKAFIRIFGGTVAATNVAAGIMGGFGFPPIMLAVSAFVGGVAALINK